MTTSQSHWMGFDEQLQKKAAEISRITGIDISKCQRIATDTSKEIKLKCADFLAEANTMSMPAIKDIHDELVSFQKGTEFIINQNFNEANRIQLIAQNYIALVYLKDSLFMAIKPLFLSGGVAAEVVDFLTGNLVREIRNAIAHGDWRYDLTPGVERFEYRANNIKKSISQSDHQTISELALAFVYVVSQELVNCSQQGQSL